MDFSNVERCLNPRCRRPFSVSEVAGKMPGSKESEDIACPHCGHSFSRMSNGFFRTSALSLEEEKRYLEQCPD